MSTGHHLAVLRDRKHWFEPMDGPTIALWWIPQDHIPTAESFSFQHPVDPPEN